MTGLLFNKHKKGGKERGKRGEKKGKEKERERERKRKGKKENGKGWDKKNCASKHYENAHLDDLKAELETSKKRTQSQ